MSGIHQSTRLGDLLVEKGKISRQQLFEAIRVQQERRLADDFSKASPAEKTELGEILVELGYISREHLKDSLSWQRKLRKTTLVMTFVAPLLTAACGGGSGGSGDPTTGVTGNTIDPASSISNIVVSSSSSSSPSNLSSSTSLSSSSATSVIDGPVLINWSPPTHRENGDYLDIAEVGGYQLRYKLKSDSQFITVNINSGYTDSYYFNYLKGDYEFEIAAFDSNGLYSDFVAVNHH